MKGEDMSINQLNFAGFDKIEVAIERLKTFEPPDGYHLAFSGGKDSVVIKALADMAGVKYDAHYLNPIIDWENYEVWEFIKEYNIKHCSLYNGVYKRLGCIGCPMQRSEGMKKDFESFTEVKKI